MSDAHTTEATTRYEVNGWLKLTEEDSYEHGCLPSSGTQFSGGDSWHGATVETVVDQLRAFVPFRAGQDAIDRDACDETGRIDICGLETNDGNEPTEAEIEAWKRGEVRLWSVTYSFRLEEVTRRPVSAAKPTA